MSHFNVAVFSHTPDEVDVLLEPFNEQVGFGSPYGVYEKYDENDTSGEQGRWYNPNARWDWYCVGGRWAPAEAAGGQDRQVWFRLHS